MTLFAWPSAAAFGRVIPKNRIYAHANASATLRRRFVEDVERIVWAFKLAPETVNLPATPQVPEIQVLRMDTRRADLAEDVLRAIDRAIPFPLIFELRHEGRVRTVAAPKQPNQADASRWRIGDYAASAWMPEDTRRTPLPVALNLEVLYEHILTALVRAHADGVLAQAGATEDGAETASTAEGALPLAQLQALMEEMQACTREVARLQRQMARTRQFNRRVEMNARLRSARQRLQQLRKKLQTANGRGKDGGFRQAEDAQS